MFHIVASYHCMQFQGKLMNQIEKMAKNLVLAPLAQILVARFFSLKIWFCQLLDIMVSYHHVQC